jgi:hypothetical protein
LAGNIELARILKIESRKMAVYFMKGSEQVINNLKY